MISPDLSALCATPGHPYRWAGVPPPNPGGWKIPSFISLCVPPQATFLGFPASMGAPFLPYAILDGIAAPRPCNPHQGRSSQGEFSEAIVRLPHSYFANSYSSAFPLDDTLFERSASAGDSGGADGGGLPPADQLGRVCSSDGGDGGPSNQPGNLGQSSGGDGGGGAAHSASALPTRADVGLPEVGVVFCCTNQLYKLDPGTFAMW